MRQSLLCEPFVCHTIGLIDRSTELCNLLAFTLACITGESLAALKAGFILCAANGRAKRRDGHTKLLCSGSL